MFRTSWMVLLGLTVLAVWFLRPALDAPVVSDETGSTWQPQRGVALNGPLRGEGLKTVAYVPAFEYAWRNFYPETTWYPTR